MARIEVTATVTGLIWDVPVSVGDTVSENDELVIAEAMKMDGDHRSGGGQRRRNSRRKG